MDSGSAFWQGKQPKNSKELNDQIQRATLALRQWVDAANIPNSEDSVMIEAQLFWLEQLLNLALVELIVDKSLEKKSPAQKQQPSLSELLKKDGWVDETQPGTSTQILGYPKPREERRPQ